MVQFDLLPSPRATPGQVRAFGPGDGELFEAVQSRGKVVGQIKNSSCLILRSTRHFSRGLHDDCGPQEYVFLRKKVGICRGEWLERKNLSKLKSVFKGLF